MIVIVPVHNQAKNLRAVLSGYLNQTRMPTDVVLVLDRCTDDSAAIASRFKLNFEVAGSRLHLTDTSKTRDYGFGAGRTRDAGIRYARENWLRGPYLFTDGDCVPSKDLVKHHSEQLHVVQPRITCGLRYETVPADQKPTFKLLPETLTEAAYDVPVQDDLRLDAEWCKDIVFGASYDRLVVDRNIFEQSWICWSCNLGMNEAAVDLCIAVNGALNGDIDRVFNSDFDGRWGGEDGFVGLTMYRCGGDVVALGRRSFTVHIYHTRSHTNSDHLRLVARKDAEMQQAITSGRVESYSLTEVVTIVPASRFTLSLATYENIIDYTPSAQVQRVLQHLPDDYVKLAYTLHASGLLRNINAVTPIRHSDRPALELRCQQAQDCVPSIVIAVDGYDFRLAMPLTYEGAEQ